MPTIWLGVGLSTLNSPLSSLPWRKCIKNPVFELPAPWPSSLYKKLGLFAGRGGSSTIEFPLIAVDTISNFVVSPCIGFENE